MATQMQLARQGVITEAMKIVAEQEHVTAEFIREGVANGTIAIPCNINHKNIIPRGVGTGLTVKVNANIGTSSSYPDPEPELAKLQADGAEAETLRQERDTLRAAQIGRAHV